MPRLHKYRDRDACYILTAVRGAVVSFQFTLAAFAVTSGLRLV
jgi:hypothetical protein